MLGIEGQKMLKPEDGIGEDRPNQTEAKKGKGVLFPALLRLWFHSKKSVKEFFKGSHDRGKKNLLPCLQNLKKVKTHWSGESQDYSHKNRQLNPSKNIHLSTSFLKLLGLEHGHKKINNQS
jgi:hypothetical protein